MKRKLTIIILAILTVVAAVFYFTKTETTFFNDKSLYEAVPVSVPVFIEASSIKSIPVNNEVIKQFSGLETVVTITDWIIKLDSTIRENNQIQNSLRNEPFIIALGLMGEKNLTPLVIQKAESNSRKKSVENLARALYPEPENKYNEIDYTGYKITSVISPKNLSVLNYCFTNGLLIASSNLVLVQQSLLQLTESGIMRNAGFVKLNNTVESQPDFGIYVNHRLFPDIISEWINTTSVESVNEFNEKTRRNHFSNIRSFRRYAAWSQLDVEMKNFDIIAKGKSVANDSLNQFLAVFNGQLPIKTQAENILPGNTSFFTSYILSNKKIFFEKLERFFQLGETYYRREDLIRKMELDLKVKFKNKFQGMVKNELIVATTNIPTDAAKKTTLFLIELDNKTKAEKQIDSMLMNYAQRKDIPEDGLKSTISVNDKNNLTIFEFPFPSFPEIWLGKPFIGAQAKYGVFYKDYLVFCNTEEGLQDYLYDMHEGNTLSKNARFQRVKNNTGNKANISIYANFGRNMNLVNEMFNAETAKKIIKKKSQAKKILAAGWQVSGGKDIFSNAISIAFDDGKTDTEETFESKGGKVSAGRVEPAGDNQVLWQCRLGNPLITKPVFTINHLDKENREILAQDRSGKLHQISNNGTIRWSIDIDGPVLSEIFQIDYLANGKLQYLFSTKNKLYIVDRNGVNLENFPVTFPSPATNGVNVLDYDNNRVYRYFVACDDKKVYAYDKEGKLMPGWNFEGTKTTVTTPVKHFRIGGKDYIVFKDKYKVYILNRKGEPVAKTAAEFENSRNPLMISVGGKPKIVATDSKGTIYYIDFDGNYTEKKVGKFGSNHFFKTDDLNGDNKPEFIFVDRKDLTVTDENGALIFTQKFANAIQNEPNIYRFGPKLKKIGIVDNKANRIYLLDFAGQIHPGFPLQGDTEFSIGKTAQGSKKLNLIAGSKAGSLVCYELD